MVFIDRKLRKPSIDEYAGAFRVTASGASQFRGFVVTSAVVYPILPAEPTKQPEIRVALEIRRRGYVDWYDSVLYDPHKRELLICGPSSRTGEYIEVSNSDQIESLIFVYLIDFFDKYLN